MKGNFIYTKQLNSLLEDETNIKFFFNLIGENILYDADYCLKIIDTVIDYCNTYSLNEAKGYMIYYLVWLKFDVADFEKALEYCLEAKNIFEGTSNKEGLTLVYNALSAVYNNLGYNNLVAETIIKGIQYAKDANNKELLNILLINAAEYNICANHIQNANDMLSYISLNFEDKYVDSLEYKSSLISIKIKENNICEALKILKEAERIDNKKRNSAYTVHIRRNLAICYDRFGMIEKADEYFIKAIELSVKNNIVYERCMSLLEYGKFLFECNRKEEGISIIQECLDITQKYKIRNILVSAAYIMHLYYKSIVDFKEALKYLELYTVTKKEQELCYLDVNVREKSGVELYKNLMELLYGEAEAIATIGENIITKTTLSEIAEALNTELINMIPRDYLLISMFDRYTGQIDMCCIMGDKDKKEITTSIEDEDSFTVYCIKKKKSILINNFQIEYKKYVSKIKILNLADYQNSLSSIYIPLYADNNNVVGTISVQSRTIGTYNTKIMNTLKIIAGYVSIAIQNALCFKKIEEMASYDSLTGILTRREIINNGNMLAINYDKTEESFCILMIDIDDFKHINNTYGHVTGDEILKLLTKTIKSFIRNDASIGRYGGDEFLLLCPRTKSEEVYNMAERIRKVVANTIFMVKDSEFLNVTLSIGLYEYNSKGLGFMKGVNLADKVLYDAKNTTKNKVICC